MFFLLGQIVQAFIGRYPVHPGKKLGIRPEIFQTLPYFYEGILHHIVGIFMLDDHTPDMPIYFLLVFFDQKLKSPFSGRAIVKKI
jgi:hypothetical protein